MGVSYGYGYGAHRRPPAPGKGGGIRALPQTIGAATLAFDYRGDQKRFTDVSATVPAGNGDSIYTWLDQAAALAAQQATSGNRPIAYLEGGRQMVRMRGQPSSRLTTAFNAAFQPNAGAYHVFLVLRNLGDTLSPFAVFGNNTSSGKGWSVFFNEGLLIMRAYGTSGGSRSRQLNSNIMQALALLELELTGSAVKARINGSEVGFVDGGGGPSGASYAGSINNTDALIFGANPVVTIPAGVDLYRVAGYAGGLTDAERAQIEAQLMADYRVPAFTDSTAAVASLGSAVTVIAAGTNFPRIPALAAGPTTVLAIYEQRYGDNDDAGHIEIELKKSTDNGATWGSAVVLASDGVNCVGNPLVIRNPVTGRIHLIYCRQAAAATEATVRAGTYAKTVFHIYSDDEGATWSAPVEITSQVNTNAAWKYFATGPGAGIALPSGRLIAAASIGISTSSALDQFGTLYTDDDGDTWGVYGPHGLPGSNETQLALASNGDVIAYSRNQNTALGFYGMLNRSTDGGQTFTANAPSADLYGTPTNAALLKLADGKLLHARIAAPTRINLNVHCSDDDGATWPRKSRVYTGASGYPSMALLPNGRVGLLYEKGSDIAFVAFDAA